mmetsp:Transcript_53131/g.88059  ORF Transcript_53131/g.88059 Transcript_53131/m.88059 type:complete len:141 (-) Transcript_53131:201-623(-)
MVRDDKSTVSKKEHKAYKSVVHGKLNLKSKKMKKTKKSSSFSKIKKATKKNVRDLDDTTTIKQKNSDDQKTEYKALQSDFEKAMEELTESERRFLERQKLNETHFIKKRSQKTHRQRIEDYNSTLSNLSEHHDIPKVGPG